MKTFNTWQQFITLLYSQIKQKDSLRDIAAGLMTQSNKWYHIGLTSIHRSTLSDANNKRDHMIFEELFYHSLIKTFRDRLLSRCRDLTPRHKFRFKNPLYTIDAYTIICSWAIAVKPCYP